VRSDQIDGRQRRRKVDQGVWIMRAMGYERVDGIYSAIAHRAETLIWRLERVQRAIGKSYSWIPRVCERPSPDFICYMHSADELAKRTPAW